MAWWWLWLACGGEPEAVSLVRPVPEEPAPLANGPRLRRLTAAQFATTVRDVFGDLTVPTTLEPDSALFGFDSAGAATKSLSALGVERYESAAYFIADQRVSDEAALRAWLPCAPEGADRACVSASVETIGRRAYRRSLEPAEVETLTSLWAEVAGAAGEREAWRDVFAAMLMSPWFLYRVELGEGGALSDVEWATRVAYLLWAGPPDDALLDDAESGALASRAGREAVVSRMMDDARFERGLRAFVTEWWHLGALDRLVKDTLVFPHAHPSLGPSAKEETLRLAVEMALDGSDWRDLLVTRRTFVDARLAALYGVPAPTVAGFAPIMLPEDSSRIGVLGHASYLALHAHSGRTSATDRGLFVRATMLCQGVPDPPADVDTSIPEPDSTSPTLRDRLQVHLEDPACSSCHLLTDPIGLAFENFDGVGRWRDTENGAPINASGDLDGVTFDDARGMAWALRDNPGLPSCWTEAWFTYAMAARPRGLSSVDWLSARWADGGYRVPELVRALALSDALRTVEAP